MEKQIFHFLLVTTSTKRHRLIKFFKVDTDVASMEHFAPRLCCYHCNILSAMGKVGATSTGT